MFPPTLGLAGRCDAASGRRQSHLARSDRSTSVFEVNASFELILFILIDIIQTERERDFY